MGFQPEDIQGQPSIIQDASTQEDWLPMYRHDCTFDTSAFNKVMLNLVVNPNINSSWLFRADVLFDDLHLEAVTGDGTVKPVITHFQGFDLKRTMVRRFIPRNKQRDEPMDQTCSFHENSDGHVQKTLVIYLPHAGSAELIPFYHPKVRGIAHLHIYDQASGMGQISVHFLPFHDSPVSGDKKTQRTAFHLLEVLYKHGRGKTEGYVKRVNHDVVVPRARFQNKLAELKARYARPLVQSWVLKTDPSKHVFEDLAIAAFLMELWADMYADSEFPGFVDIGCGNGLLVYLLTQEGYKGWGFDARERVSWEQYKTKTAASSSSPTGFSLEERLLLPAAVTMNLPKAGTGDRLDVDKVHDGMFPGGTFIISNHADELTPWTPILATMSKSPFIMIPCCSHSLTGNKYRAPPPRDKSKGTSTYASLVDWVSLIAEDCGWKAEMEVLRIPSTRNICILGRDRTKDYPETDVDEVIRKNGGVDGFYENVVKLLKQGPRAH